MDLSRVKDHLASVVMDNSCQRTGCRELAAASWKPKSHVQHLQEATTLTACPVPFVSSLLTSEDYFLNSDGFSVKAQAEMSFIQPARIHTYIH